MSRKNLMRFNSWAYCAERRAASRRPRISIAARSTANPEQSQVHHNLGNLLHSIGRNDEAVAAQREAIRLKPNYVEAHLNLGLALLLTGDFTGAEQSFRAALRIQPNFTFAKQSLAIALNEQNRPKEAETLLRQTLALGSRDPRQIARWSTISAYP
jgi:Flp pilus assembly protein TadD